MVAPQIPDIVLKDTRTMPFLPSFMVDKSDPVAKLRSRYPEIREIAAFDYFAVTMKLPETQLGKMMQDEKTRFIAVEPSAFAAMVKMEYAQGEPATALKQLESGGHVYVTTEFYNTRKLGVGDKIPMLTADGTYADFTIAAVVSSTGVEVVKNYFDLRASFADKSISSVLGSIGDARKHFKFGQPTLMLINVDPAVARAGGMTRLRNQLSRDGMTSLSSVEIKHTFDQLLERIINGLSVIGVGALVVASLGVANMVIASIHARRFEFGVLRAIGAGRGQLVRLVLAEVTLVGLIAGVLGAGAGLTFAFMATRIDAMLLGFPTSFIDPVLSAAVLYAALLMAVAVGLTTLLGWLACLIPAVRGATSAQRSLLAAGRA
jgi:putative ABC transport system permease protein